MNPSASRTPAVLIVALILVVETSVLLGLSGFLIYQLVVDTPGSTASAIGLVLIAMATTAWIGVTTIGLASNQGLFARPDIASGLLVPALLALALLLVSPSVSRHLGTASDAA
jgi:hypothetical protein